MISHINCLVTGFLLQFAIALLLEVEVSSCNCSFTRWWKKWPLKSRVNNLFLMLSLRDSLCFAWSFWNVMDFYLIIGALFFWMYDDFYYVWLERGNFVIWRKCFQPRFIVLWSGLVNVYLFHLNLRPENFNNAFDSKLAIFIIE